MWTSENDTKTRSVDANLFENGGKQLRFCLKTDWCGRGLSVDKTNHAIRWIVIYTSTVDTVIHSSSLALCTYQVCLG